MSTPDYAWDDGAQLPWCARGLNIGTVDGGHPFTAVGGVPSFPITREKEMERGRGGKGERGRGGEGERGRGGEGERGRGGEGEGEGKEEGRGRGLRWSEREHR